MPANEENDEILKNVQEIELYPIKGWPISSFPLPHDWLEINESDKKN